MVVPFTSCLSRHLGESRMILRWIFFGTVLAAAIRAFVPVEVFGAWFGPTWLGVVLTLLAATVIEVCSEGSSPVCSGSGDTCRCPREWLCFPDGGCSNRLHGDHGAQRDHALVENDVLVTPVDLASGGNHFVGTECLGDIHVKALLFGSCPIARFACGSGCLFPRSDDHGVVVVADVATSLVDNIT